MTKTTYTFIFTNVRIIIFKSVVTYDDYSFSLSVIFHVLYTIPFNHLGILQAILPESFSLLLRSWKLPPFCGEWPSTVLTLAESLFWSATHLWAQAIPYWSCMTILKLYFFPVQSHASLKLSFLFCSLLFPWQIWWCCIIILFKLFIALRLSSFTLAHPFLRSDYFRCCISNLFFLKSFLAVPGFCSV